MKMPFGKHKGCEIREIPTQYLRWLLRECDIDSDLAGEINQSLYFHSKQDTAPTLPHVDALKDIYRRLSMRWHPDRGGTTEAMQAVNEFYSEIRGAHET